MGLNITTVRIRRVRQRHLDELAIDAHRRHATLVEVMIAGEVRAIAALDGLGQVEQFVHVDPAFEDQQERLTEAVVAAVALSQVSSDRAAQAA